MKSLLDYLTSGSCSHSSEWVSAYVISSEVIVYIWIFILSKGSRTELCLYLLWLLACNTSTLKSEQTATSTNMKSYFRSHYRYCKCQCQCVSDVQRTFACFSIGIGCQKLASEHISYNAVIKSRVQFHHLEEFIIYKKSRKLKTIPLFAFTISIPITKLFLTTKTI